MPMISEAKPGGEGAELRGLEGWLLLVGFGWTALTVPGSPAYHRLWAPLLIAETGLNILLLTGSVVCLLLFFRKRRIFPRVAIAWLLVGALAPVLGLVMTRAVPGVEVETAEIREAVQGGLGAIIWIPYFLESKRVRATFVE
jgi:uncharacterized membrane protein YfcA